MGGERFSPVLYNESMAAREIKYDESRPFTQQGKTVSYLDVTITYKTNHKRYSGTWALQVKNALASSSDNSYYFNYRTNSIEKDKLTIVLPVLSYKIEF